MHSNVGGMVIVIIGVVVVRSELPKDVDIVAFQCRNPIHRAHYEVSGCSIRYCGGERKVAALLIIIVGT